VLAPHPSVYNFHKICENSLSKDFCHFSGTPEIQRGTFSLSEQYQVRARVVSYCVLYIFRLILFASQACVRRSAVLSLLADPNCRDKGPMERARRVVTTVTTILMRCARGGFHTCPPIFTLYVARGTVFPGNVYMPDRLGNLFAVK
jgi:hypothetical protein